MIWELVSGLCVCVCVCVCVRCMNGDHNNNSPRTDFLQLTCIRLIIEYCWALISRDGTLNNNIHTYVQK